MTLDRKHLENIAQNDSDVKEALFEGHLNAAEMEQIIGALATNTEVTDLIFEKGSPDAVRPSIGLDGVLQLADFIGKNRTLTWLSMANRLMKDTAAVNLIMALNKNKKLTGVDLSNTGLTHEHIAALNMRRFKKLYLGGNEVSKAAAIAIKIALQETRKPIFYLEEIQHQPSKLRALSLRKVGLTDETVSIIAQGLATNASLAVLDLSGHESRGQYDSYNNITAVGLKNLVDALIQQKMVVSLNLTGNHLGDAGLAELTRLLQAQTSISKLVISMVGITDAGLYAFFAALKKNKTLINLQLKGPPIGDVVADKIIEILSADKGNCTLLKLWLTCNDPDKQIMIDGLLQMNNARGNLFATAVVTESYPVVKSLLDQGVSPTNIMIDNVSTNVRTNVLAHALNENDAKLANILLSSRYRYSLLSTVDDETEQTNLEKMAQSFGTIAVPEPATRKSPRLMAQDDSGRGSSADPRAPVAVVGPLPQRKHARAMVLDDSGGGSSAGPRAPVAVTEPLPPRKHPRLMAQDDNSRGSSAGPRSRSPAEAPLPNPNLRKSVRSEEEGPSGSSKRHASAPRSPGPAPRSPGPAPRSPGPAPQ